MAYTRDWDEGTPLGTASAATLETIIQNLKTDLRERLEEVIPAWSDDDIDPKYIIVASGLAADRPATDQSTGQVYLATDTSVLSFYDGAAWVDFEIAANLASLVLVGAIADIPDAADVDEGTLYWASDEDIMYVQEAAAWINVTSAPAGSAIRAAVLDLSAAEGSRSSNSWTIGRTLTILVTGATTDANGKVVVDFDEFEGEYSIYQLLSGYVVASPGSATVAMVTLNTALNDYDNNKVTFVCYDFAGVAINAGSVSFKAICPFLATGEES